ncbi:LysR substrate-binding domain-containing protein [Pseudomonas cichorii]|uniref:LysR substrate-binding domain-containing protein n=1 Tax=Pseudomonas cichorii TaxID=36746 RepID=UPI001C8A3547|nr:LysR substrate-binding domain-containing protein [Pseudomonas cichorii]MBX8486254.1 LysR family transcriptional regulator [Pseudomonas cichorii]MBX8496470.1 LysR family transcriptional regulator [Pseudomonas cichorii]MBX8575330.1 LysR family transcriptional regulator [Pseudomonas cichorii]
MFDLNDLFYFVQVVECQGFAAASRKLGIPKSKLSRRVAGLEERLGVRLIQRSTRKFAVTESGRDYYGHCVAMMVEAEAAEEAIARSRAEPQGRVTISCPPGLASMGVSETVARFMVAHPKVHVHLESSNRRVDPLAENIDIALRVRSAPLEDDGLVVKIFGHGAHRLVAHPALARQLSARPVFTELAALPSLDLPSATHEHSWQLTVGPEQYVEVRHTPRLVSSDFDTLLQTALHGVGVVVLPELLVRDALHDGRLVELFAENPPKYGIVHAVFASRRGLLPAVRGLLDAFDETFRSLHADWRPTVL